MNSEIAKRRLHNQYVTRPGLRTPEAVVTWFGAVQAQEYAAARWGLGLRMPVGARDVEIERAFDAGRILRTHVMRPTWHFVRPADIRWMLELTAPRVQRAMASYNRQLELDLRTLTRATKVFERALRDTYLTRRELGARLETAGIVAEPRRLAHIALHAELERVICSGPRRGKQFTYALLDQRAPRAASLTRDEALAELATRFFRSHGPATVRDFVWWSGLTTADAKRGLEAINARHTVADGLAYWSLGDSPSKRGDAAVHLLPIYDEYLVAYRDRHAVPHLVPTAQSLGRSVRFQHALVIDGQVAGTWRTAANDGRVRIEVLATRRLTVPERQAIAKRGDDYARFLDVPVTLAIQ